MLRPFSVAPSLLGFLVTAHGDVLFVAPSPVILNEVRVVKDLSSLSRRAELKLRDSAPALPPNLFGGIKGG
jgi:hypothetical protein